MQQQNDNGAIESANANDPDTNEQVINVNIKKTATEELERKKSGLYDRYGFLIPLEQSNDSLTRARHGLRNESPEEKKKRIQLEVLRIEKWQKMILKWNQVQRKKTNLLKKRIRKGIPDVFRGKIWPLICGSNEMKNASNVKYSSLVGKLDEILLVDSEQLKVQDAIMRDITRTFPRHIIFQEKDGVGQKALTNVLRAYSIYDDEVGYCQGMGFIVGLLLGYVTEEQSFWILVTLMKSKQFEMCDMFKPGMPGSQCILYQYEAMLLQFFPKVAKHLEAENIVSSMYATHWFITVFTYSFPFEIVVRVWDVFLNEGWKAIFRLALALIKIHEKTILGCHFEQILEFFRGMPEKLNADELFAVAFKLNLKSKQLEEAKLKWHEQNKTD